MLLQNPYFYYKVLREKFEKSYIAEDIDQIFVGIYYDERHLLRTSSDGYVNGGDIEN